MLVATYDYWGYYNVCFLGDEIKDPEKNIPRALVAFHSAGRVSISNDEPVHPGRCALAGDAAGGTEQHRLVCCVFVYAEGLRVVGGTTGDRACHRYRRLRPSFR